MAQHGLLGHMTSPVDVSYLTDTVVLLRYFEFQGAVRKAISVIKKRSGRARRHDPGISPQPPGRFSWDPRFPISTAY